MAKEIEAATPLVPIVLDRPRNLLLSFGGMIALKKKTGKDLFDPKTTEALAKDIGMEDMIALTWACLIHEDRDLTLEDVGFLIHIGNIDLIMEALEKVFDLAMPEGGKETAPLVRKNRRQKRHPG